MSKPELSDPITLRIPLDVLEDIERIAGAIDRSRSWVMVRALRLYLAGEGEEVLGLLKAREESAADGGHDADDVMRELLAIANGTKAA
ncbi:MAG: ribbon-helix-helix protein, CopG family [Opitutus sp.]|nr:ribbon-helix-helix protein, CopG family [Opitutus sp.]